MKLQAVFIKNYRSFQDVSIELQGCSFVVGANNAGKSNFIDAIRCFFGDIPFDPDKDCRKNGKVRNFKDEATAIGVSFSDIPPTSVPDDLRDFISEDSRISIWRNFGSFAESSTGRYEVSRRYGTDKETKSFRMLPSCFQASIAYVPSMSKPSDELRLTGPSALRSLIGDIFGAAFEKSELCKTINRAIRKLEKREAVTGDATLASLRGLENSVSRGLKAWGASFSLTPKSISGADIMRNLLEVRICDHETSSDSDLSSFGSGFQRNLLFQIIKIGADELPTVSSKCRLLLFEEPEAFLHPDQQTELARNLKRLSEVGYQVVCTTHSPYFIERMMENLPGIIRLERRDGVTIGYQMSQSEWIRFGDTNADYPEYLKVSGEKRTPEFDMFRYALWLNGARAPVFFAKRVLLVEGATETALFSQLLDDGKLRLPTGTVVIDCCGKFNFHRFMSLLSRFGIPFAVVYDDDSLKKDVEKREEQKRWNRFVEETAKKFGVKTMPLKGDIETILGIEKPDSRPDTKPYHLLSEYKQGNCQNVDDLCSNIQRLFE